MLFIAWLGCHHDPVDQDRDGWGAGLDCDDVDPLRHPGAEEQCDGVDHDCDGQIGDRDADRDGLGAAECGGDDCDDADLAIGAAADAWIDEDGDGWAGTAVTGCDIPAGASLVSEDCDDADRRIGPGVPERCDGVDQDCDGAIDEIAVDRVVRYPDADHDGFGDPDRGELVCAADPSDLLGDASDCDDADATVHPAAVEVCANGHDDDCDGLAPDCGPFGIASIEDLDVSFTYEGDGIEVDQLLPVGDVNGDGDADLIVSHQLSSSVAGDDLRLFLGPFDRPDLAMEDAWSVHEFNAYALAGTTDFDGDSELDLVVVASADSPIGGGAGNALWVLFGPAWHQPGTVWMPYEAEDRGATFYAAAPEDLGNLLPALPGDVDEDGMDDLLIGGDRFAEEPNGTAWLVRGGSISVGESRSLAEATPMVSTSAEDYLGDSVLAAGDLDGDGIGDLAISAPTEDVHATDGGVVHLVYGGAAELAGPTLEAAATLYLPVPASLFGLVLAAAGDTDGDGLPDLAVANPCLNACVGGAYSGELRVFLGGPRLVGPVDASVAATALLHGVAWENAILVNRGGDLDGNGLDDLTLGTEYGTQDAGLWLLPAPFAGTTARDAHPGASKLASAEDEIAAVDLGDLDGDGDVDLGVWSPFSTVFGDPTTGIVWGGPGW